MSKKKNFVFVFLTTDKKKTDRLYKKNTFENLLINSSCGYRTIEQVDLFIYFVTIVIWKIYLFTSFEN